MLRLRSVTGGEAAAVGVGADAERRWKARRRVSAVPNPHSRGDRVEVAAVAFESAAGGLDAHPLDVLGRASRRPRRRTPGRSGARSSPPRAARRQAEVVAGVGVDAGLHGHATARARPARVHTGAANWVCPPGGAGTSPASGRRSGRRRCRGRPRPSPGRGRCRRSRRRTSRLAVADVDRVGVDRRQRG